MPEKSITRLMCGVKKLNGYLQPYMSPAVQGEYVRWEEHEDFKNRLTSEAVVSAAWDRFEESKDMEGALRAAIEAAGEGPDRA